MLQKRVIRLFCGAKTINHRSVVFYNMYFHKVLDIVELKTFIIMFPMNRQKYLLNYLLTYLLFLVKL